MRIRSLVRAATAAAILGLVAPTAARAQTFWDLAGMTTGGDLGSSHVFTLGPTYGSFTVTASTGWDVYRKNVSPSDVGLGLCDVGTGHDRVDGHTVDVTNCAHGNNNGSSFEIGDLPTNAGGYLTFDFTNLLVNVQSVVLSSLSHDADFAHYYTRASCSSGSYADKGNVTDNNGDQIYTLTNSSVTGADCIKFGSDSYNAAWWEWCQTHDFGDYLVMGLWTSTPGTGTTTETTVPEPATMTLLATGLVGMMGAARRRRSKK